MIQRALGTKVKLALVSIAVLGLVLPLYIIPNAAGDMFTHASLRTVNLSCTSDPAGGLTCPPTGTFTVLGENNTTITVVGLSFSITVSNSYFLPVIINYKGLDLSVLIYSVPVSKPGDISFAQKLVWLATASADVGDEDNVRFPSSDELVEHVVSVPQGGLRYDLGDEASTWNGTDSTGEPAIPGTYYVYALAFGKLSAPAMVRIA